MPLNAQTLIEALPISWISTRETNGKPVHEFEGHGCAAEVHFCADGDWAAIINASGNLFRGENAEADAIAHAEAMIRKTLLDRLDSAATLRHDLSQVMSNAKNTCRAVALLAIGDHMAEAIENGQKITEGDGGALSVYFGDVPTRDFQHCFATDEKPATEMWIKTITRDHPAFSLFFDPLADPIDIWNRHFAI